MVRSLRDKKILVVDDEPEVVKLISLKLTKEGFEVLEASNGEEALEKILSEKPDVVLLDFMMPKMSGWDVFMRLKEDAVFRDLPIIAVTAMGHFEEIIKHPALEFDGYIIKPFDTEEIVKKIREVLKISKET